MTSRITIVQPGSNRRYFNNYPRIVRIVPRPRINIADYFTNHKPRSNTKKIQISFYMEPEPENITSEECGVCLNDGVRNCNMVLLTDCGHSICDDCLSGMAKCKSCNLVCPFCREEIENVEVQSGESFNTLKNHSKVFKTDLNYLV
jgi:hypothetical protein